MFVHIALPKWIATGVVSLLILLTSTGCATLSLQAATDADIPRYRDPPTVYVAADGSVAIRAGKTGISALEYYHNQRRLPPDERPLAYLVLPADLLRRAATGRSGGTIKTLVVDAGDYSLHSDASPGPIRFDYVADLPERFARSVPIDWSSLAPIPPQTSSLSYHVAGFTMRDVRRLSIDLPATDAAAALPLTLEIHRPIDGFDRTLGESVAFYGLLPVTTLFDIVTMPVQLPYYAVRFLQAL